MKTLLLCFLLSAFCFSSRAAVLFGGLLDIAATSSNSVNGPIPISCSAWVFVNGNPSNGVGVVCMRGAGFVVSGWVFAVNGPNTLNGTNTVLFQAGYATSRMVKTSAAQSVPSNRWVHVAATWDGGTSTNGIILYVSGAAAGNFRNTAPAGGWISDSNLCFSLGNRNDSPSIGFRGMIQDVAVWTNVLTAAEIATLAKPRIARLPLMVNPKTLVGYWPMDGGPDGTAVTPVNCITDLSGRGNHASPTNSPTWKASPLSYP